MLGLFRKLGSILVFILTAKDKVVVNCPYCGEEASAEDANCPSCGKALASEDKGNPPSFSKTRGLIKLIPLWILIAIDVYAIIRILQLGRDLRETDLPPEAGLLAISFAAILLGYIAALVVGNLIYLGVWAWIAHTLKDNNDSSST